MLPVRIGLISKTDTVTFAQMVPVANALSIQLNRDVGPIWGVSGSVVALEDDTHLDPGTWPIYIADVLDGSMTGNHSTVHNQPLAVIEPGDSWSLTASHELLEMAVDPYGNRLVPAPAIGIGPDGKIVDVPGKVEYLVEVCDPTEDPKHAYLIDDVLVADFYTPAYFDPAGTQGGRYSFTGAITRPRDVLPGGYLTWHESETCTMKQLKNNDPGGPTIEDLAGGQPVTADLLGARSLRSFVDSVTTGRHRLSKLPPDHPQMQRRRAYRAKLEDGRTGRADLFRAALAAATRGAHAVPKAAKKRGSES